MARIYWTFGIGVIMAAATAALAQQPAAPTASPPAVKSDAAPAPRTDAHPQPPPSAGRGPFAACRADVANLCKDAPSGLVGRLQCLKTNQDKLSPDCIGAIRGLLGTVQAKAAAIETAPRPIKACQQDLATLCPDVAAIGGRIKCLRDNAPKLSSGCAEAVKTARTQTQDALLACEADRTKLCAGAGGKAGEQMKCLKEKTAELSAQCRQLVAAIRPVKTSGKAEVAPPGAPAPPVLRSILPPPTSAPAPGQPAPPKG